MAALLAIRLLATAALLVVAWTLGFYLARLSDRGRLPWPYNVFVAWGLLAALLLLLGRVWGWDR